MNRRPAQGVRMSSVRERVAGRPGWGRAAQCSRGRAGRYRGQDNPPRQTIPTVSYRVGKPSFSFLLYISSAKIGHVPYPKPVATTTTIRYGKVVTC